MKMCHNLQIFMCLIFFASVSGLTLKTIQHCCTLGENYASSGSECKTFKPPISGIEKGDEKSCLATIDTCCKKHFRKAQCNSGIEDAKKGSCDSTDEERKQCCDACAVGLETGKSGSTCDDPFGFGPAFTTCCESQKTSTTTAVTTATPFTSAKTKSTSPDRFSPLPSHDNICDSGDVCTQTCEREGGTYKCGCYPGFALMADGVSCKPMKRTGKTGNRCELNNPCEHECTDTGTAIKCTCFDGYELRSDQKTCSDIDECALNIFECEPNEVCVNDPGGYFCETTDPSGKCSFGYTFNETSDSCIDIDECLTDLHNCGFDEKCVNEDGSFSCIPPEPFKKCPEGYKFNGTINSCDDVDECQFGIMCPRPKICINTVGSFTCTGGDAEVCPPGYYFNTSIDDCADIDECTTDEHNCNRESQVCLNTKGNYTCTDKASKTTCPAGFKINAQTKTCEDINECEENPDTCKEGETCVNEQGGHNCIPATKSTVTSTPKTTTTTKAATTIKTRTFSKIPAPPPGPPAVCPKGQKYSGYGCYDINECEEDPEACDSNQNCLNTPGSYICQCKIGFTKDFHTGACVDINECQANSHTCTYGQRCDNTMGSFICSRITGCGTGYTLNYQSGICEDDDECKLGTHNCAPLGPKFRCRNLLGSFRCEPVKPVPSTPVINPFLPPNRVTPILPTTPKQTIPTTKPTPKPYTLPPATPSTTTRATVVNLRPYVPLNRYNPPPYPVRTPVNKFNPYSPSVLLTQRKNCLSGYRMNSQGQCEDINECESNPCVKGEKCVNYNGTYQCIPSLICKLGYEPNESGDNCVDVNECTRGTHTCDYTQICKNGPGYYTCQCPPGHHLNPATKKCMDIDECKSYRPCDPQNSVCVNTPGSYKCNCKAGFNKINNRCVDIDECSTIPGLCSQKCINLHGSYSCRCNSGFELSYDNRTCIDVNECEKFSKVCVHNCKNIPGSYVCECPSGYTLGNDKRVCLDINECQRNPNVCGAQDTCVNTRGGYKCYSIQCPPGYIKEPGHKSRCKRAETHCDPRDIHCLLQPEHYTYQYIAVVSNIPLLDSPIQLFQIKGPQWDGARAEFTMKIMEVHCPPGRREIDDYFFKKEYNGTNSMQLFLTRGPEGPQEAKLQIEMKLFRGNAMIANIVVYIILVVSEYPF